MCGITGFFTSSAKGEHADSTKNLAKLKEMSSSLSHRGPDQYGTFVGNEQLFLAHQRLSIIDLSDAGRQPMTSHNGRYVLVYNGEIYNYKELRNKLEQKVGVVNWVGHSDTEVLLELIAYFGLKSTLPMLNGMFAFCLYDKKDNTVSLARDRFGEKPLYVYSDSNSFAFASEMQALEIFTNKLSVNQAAVDAQFRFSYIPDPYTIYNEVKKLNAGSYLTISLDSFDWADVSRAEKYWCVEDAVKHGIANKRNSLDAHEITEHTEELLKQSISRRMLSDVPLGAFLSGGVDSTCVVSLMQELSSKKIKTFSIGFNDSQYNEAKDAKVIANILGTEHHELYIDAKNMLDFIPRLHDIYGEPFADSSQLPTLAVSEFAKEHVSVALTGDAGDEVFCGYNRYLWGNKVISKTKRYPSWARNLMSKSALLASPASYDKYANLLSSVFSKLKELKTPGDKVHKLARVLDYENEKDLYYKLIQTWPERGVIGDFQCIETGMDAAFSNYDLPLAERMMWQDSIGYLKNDILTKVDRASMAFSLETRIPFLDNDVYEYSWQLPLEYKLRGSQTKYPLRKIISKRIPDNVMERPKSGFGVPIHSWLRSELKEWAEELLSVNALSSSGFLDVDKIRSIWTLHKSGKRNMQYALWNVLMFQQWHSRQVK